MIRSIRYFLLISLLLSITIASAINGIGNYLLDEKVVQPYLDSQLLRMSTLIDMLYQSTHLSAAARKDIISYLHPTQLTTNQKFVFQVWSPDGHLVLNSSPTLDLNLKNSRLGYSDIVVNTQDWRVYASTDNKQKAKIVVAEMYTLRRELADDIAHSNANILLITYPVFGILVWFIVTLALRSITRVTSEISNRASTYLEPVQLTEIPVEIKPLVGELNRLFIRLRLAFERNKRFAADAAHELRTPLAALKTHVQVALKSDNDKDRNKALGSVIQSVDRSAHVVDQLLTLSRLGEEESLTDIKPVDLHKLAVEIIAYLVPHAFEKNIDIELAPPPAHPIVMGSDTALGILIRNVVDNAIRYTPTYGEVRIAILETDTQIVLQVTDTGMGIPPELRERVFERFFRVLGTQASGSGLGLAIVSQITALHHGEIRLQTPPNNIGLQFEVAFPKVPA
jgi:two-component system sensor histidine kinase QseC